MNSISRHELDANEAARAIAASLRAERLDAPETAGRIVSAAGCTLAMAERILIEERRKRG